jgi:hypothetical protein
MTGAMERLRALRRAAHTVRTDRRNRLIYETAAPATQLDGVPRRLILDGTWGLSADHRLRIAVRQSGEARRQAVQVGAGLLRASAKALTFAVRRHEADGRVSAQELTLRGRWQADARNRLVFHAAKADGSEDRLTLSGAWELGPHHELLYQYRQRTGRGRAGLRTLRFAGTWDVVESHRLVYRLEGSDDSAFAFRASLQTPSLNARDGRLAYQVGIELADGRVINRRVTLFGAWKLNRDLSAAFEIPYEGGRREAIRFSGTLRFASRNELTVELADHRRRPLGLTVTFTRRFLKDARWFLRFEKAGRDVEALAGVQVPF